MPHELKGKEIFSVGTWNGIEFSEKDLDELISNFNTLKDSFKVPLKFGHDEDHKDGQPAIGWISRVFKEGGKLLADFTDIPKTVFDAINAKLYRTISVEILLNAKINGDRFFNVLDAVALLGADRPAVSNLNSLDALLATRTAITGGHRVAFETIAGKSEFKVKVPKEDLDLDKKEVQELIDAATKPLADNNVKLTKDLKDANDTIAQFTSDKADDEKTAKEEKVKLARKTVTDVLDAAVRSKAMTPANRTVYEAQIGVDDDERVLKIDVEQIKTMFSVKDVDQQTGLHKDQNDNGDSDNPEAELLTLVRKNQADTGEKDFSVSFSAVAAANPKLHKAYLDANGEQ